MANDGYAPMMGTPPYFSPWDTGMGGDGGMGGWGGMASWGMGGNSASGPGMAAPVSVPQANVPAPQMGTRLGFNMPTANLALSGLSTIGNLWAAFQAQKLAREQFKYTKNVTDTNLANQIKSYNTTLADRSFSRAKVEGRDNASAQSYIDSNSLRRYGT